MKLFEKDDIWGGGLHLLFAICFFGFIIMGSVFGIRIAAFVSIAVLVLGIVGIVFWTRD